MMFPHSLSQLCQQHQALLLNMDDNTLYVAVAGAPSPQLAEALRFASNRTIDISICSDEQMENYRLSSQKDLSLANSSHAQPADTLNEILLQAMHRRASDIHFEPEEAHYQIRLRIDGVLHPLPPLPTHFVPGITARLKILGELDIAEKRLPQDGQFTIHLANQQISFRLSTLPCRCGEKAVLRLLQQQKKPLQLDTLGMGAHDLKRYRQALTAPQGLILVTGPTGSGKTLTLYSGLAELNQPSRNICSAEDPIEIPLKGINQTQINLKAELTFQKILRSLLRQDPDVIMIGEIRDAETAEIAIKAAQTGHLVLSTLHTNSTVETLSRLEQMGVARWLIVSALHLVIAQRLVRRLCPHCRVRNTQDIVLPSQLWSSPLPNWQATGCEHCYSGFYGRTALFELLVLNNSLRDAITQGAPSGEIQKLAHQQGMNTLYKSGFQAIADGLTTLEEIWRVLGVPHE